jgi:hypothetical protein
MQGCLEGNVSAPDCALHCWDLSAMLNEAFRQLLRAALAKVAIMAPPFINIASGLELTIQFVLPRLKIDYWLLQYGFFCPQG